MAFSEIHPDYYRIPVEDRQKLIAEASAKTEEELSSNLTNDQIVVDDNEDDVSEEELRKVKRNL